MKGADAFVGIKVTGSYTFSLTAFDHGDYSTIHKGKKVLKEQYLQLMNQKDTHVIMMMSNFKAEKIANRISTLSKNLKKFNDSQATVTCIEWFRTPHYFYFIFPIDQIDGELISLERYLKQGNNHGNLPYHKKVKIAQNLANTLKILHDHKIMHRTINPKHILISPINDKIKFCGLKTMHVFENEPMPIEPFGVDFYRAPEVERSNVTNIPYNEKVDIFSFGSVLYYLFTGKLYDTMLNDFQINELKNIGTMIKKLLIGCLNIDPKRRMSSTDIISTYFYTTGQSDNYVIEIPKLPEICITFPQKDTIEPYILEEMLGVGAFGKVYKAKEEKNNITTIYAFKEVNLSKINTTEARKIIKGEVDLLNKLRNLSFVINLKEYFMLKDNLCMVLEFCNGGSLADYVDSFTKRRAYMPMDEIRFIAWNMAEGLNEMHLNNIIHRDLKPDNILLVKNSSNRIIDAKICDLGLGIQLKDAEPGFNNNLGTEGYKAPEFYVERQRVRPFFTNKVDVYSFGLCLIFMLYGKDAYDFNPKKEDFFNGLIILPRCPVKGSEMLLDLIKKCLQREPKDRISFEDIIKHEFFCHVSFSTLNQNIWANTEHEYTGNTSLGFIDEKKSLYIKSYREEYEISKETYKYIIREIQFLSRCMDIPHMIQMRSYGKSKAPIRITYGKNHEAIFDEHKLALIETTTIIFELCKGKCLYFLRNQRASDFHYANPFNVYFQEDEIICVIKSLIEFVDEIHRRNYLHRSINPKHILIVLDNKDKISDVKICGLRTTKTEMLDPIVSQIVDKELSCYTDPLALQVGFSEESDLWSIGMVIYVMASGKVITNPIEISIIRNKGCISIPSYVQPEIGKFINFCLMRRTLGELASSNLIEELRKNQIIYH